MNASDRATIATRVALAWSLASICAVALAQSPPVSQPQLQSCLKERIAPRATEQGVSRALFDRLTADLKPATDVLEKLDFQPEFVTPVWDYMAALVDDARIEGGRRMLEHHRGLLDAIERQYGVPREIIVAVWGVESNFGANLGRRSLIESLATLSCFGRRQTFFSGELVAALRIVAGGNVSAERLTGSWAGAFGHTQFMPSTFMLRAVDGDGDGRRDLMDSIPDALASTANYLRAAGWRAGQPWGFEVEVPRGVRADSDSRTVRRPVSDWRAAGVKPVRAEDRRAFDALAPDTPAALIRPADVGGPAFVVLRNYDAVFAYNPSINYALAIAHLADRMRGATSFVTPWPTTDVSLSRAERRELQTLLLLRGHDIGEVDGILGTRSREAVRAEQARLGEEVTGRADQALLEALRVNR